MEVATPVAPILLGSRFAASPQKLAFVTPIKSSRPAVIGKQADQLARQAGLQVLEPTCSERLITAQETLEGQACSHDPTDDPKSGYTGPSAPSFVPPSRHLQRITPPPKSESARGVRRSPHERATTMAPMLRARHMDILDQRYLEDCGTSAPGDRSCVRAPGRSSSVRHAKNSAGESTAVSHRPSSRQQSRGPKPATWDTAPQRLIGPKAVMPLVKGQLRIQAEAKRSEADKVARDAKLKEQFRSRVPRSSSCVRAKSKGRSDIN